MDRNIPLISTRSKGPLGLAHLPRLWLKMRLAGKSVLAEGYHAGHGGFDGALLEALGIEPDAAAGLVAEAQPSYLEFEDWIRDHARAESLTAESIAAINDRILGFPKPEPGRTEMLQALGLPVDDKPWLGSDINDLDDWNSFHLMLREGA
jgi:hypothetical protein